MKFSMTIQAAEHSRLGRSAFGLAFLCLGLGFLAVPVGVCRDLSGDKAGSVLTVHYRRNEGDYLGWTLWTWNAQTNRDSRDVYPSGVDEFGLVFRIERSNYGTDGSPIGILPKHGNWESKDVPDRTWHSYMGSEVWILADDPQICTSPPVSERARPRNDPARLGSDPVVVLETRYGDIRIELFEGKAPVSVANFLSYVNDGFYDDTIFHRVLKGYLVQAGGMNVFLRQKTQKDPILNEADNGLSNKRGTVSMARTAEIHSATSHFFINLKDNPQLDHKGPDPATYGYAVFGEVADDASMQVVDAIGEVDVTTKDAYQNLPVVPVVIRRAYAMSSEYELAKGGESVPPVLTGSVERGESLFHDPGLGTSGMSCGSCHQDGGRKNVRIGDMVVKAFDDLDSKYPKYWEMADKVITLPEMVNWCIVNPLSGKALEEGDQRLADLIAYCASLDSGEAEPEKGFKSLPPLLKIASVSFSAGYMDAEKTEHIEVVIENVGPGDAENVEVRLTGSAVSGLSYPQAVTAGSVRANGGRETVEIPVSSDANLIDGEAEIRIEVIETAWHLKKVAKILTFPTYALAVPDLDLAKYTVRETFPDNNRIDKNEMVSVEVIIQNVGEGPAENVSVEIMSDQAGVVPVGHISDGNVTRADIAPISELAAGEYEKKAYCFLVDDRFSEQEIRFEVAVRERRGTYGSTSMIRQPINTAAVEEGEITRVPEPPVKRGGVTIEDVPDLVVDVDQRVPETGMKNPYAIAVVIGNRDYEKAGSVTYALNDVAVVRSYLISALGYREGNVFSVKNARLADFQSLFGKEGHHKGRLYNAVKPGESDVFVYYSGHGAPGFSDRRGYFVPVDCVPTEVELNGYPLDVLYANLSKIPARSIVVVLDACFSGSGLLEGLSPIVPTVEGEMLLGENAVVLTSASGAQPSTWYDEKSHGMFTYFFLKGIQDGNGDADGDGLLTYDELYRFVSDKSEGVPYHARRLHGIEQTPTIEGGGMEKVLVRYR